MRAGVCSIPQALTTEATSIVKQAFSLARRRGHSQVTPLHVASAMLATSSSLLRRSCLKSHSHPLQCKALELCFNVALNRLPTSTSTTPFLLGSHTHSSNHYPSLSNALVAAFKRAQAHQRRGSVESQQQPILALKIEIEQLVMSILDDPSVSRVMREAGFSSPHVKTNVEQTISLDFCSPPPPPPPSLPSSLLQLGVTLAEPLNQIRNTTTTTTTTTTNNNNNDVMSVFDALMIERKRNNLVIVGESLGSAEGVVRGVMDKLEKGSLNGNVKFISLQSLFSLKNVSKEMVVEQKLVELKCLVRNHVGKGTIVLYLGDLKWVTEFWSHYCEQKRSYYEFSVERMIIMEIRKLVCGDGGGAGRLVLMGIATFQTYMRCKAGHPSLESIWELRPLAIPVGTLGLSLKIDSDLEAESRSKVSEACTNWSVNFDRREAPTPSMATSISTITTTSMTSKLPSWLQQYKEENMRQTINDQEYVHVEDLCKKPDSFFGSVHQKHTKLDQTDRLISWPVIFESKSSPKKDQNQQLWMHEKDDESIFDQPNLKMFIPDLLSNPNSSPNSATSSEAAEEDGTEDLDDDLPMFKELNAKNLKILCNALERKVPWQKEIIPEIVSTILQCRSGMMKIQGKSKQCSREAKKEETWFFFLGADSEGKVKIARELARLVFGSPNNFVSINSGCSFSTTRGDSTDNKRKERDEPGSSLLERFADALHENPHRVFFVEELEQVDYISRMGIKKAIESGSIRLPSSGELVSLKDAIVIFSIESFSSMSRASSPPPPPPPTKRKCSDDTDSEDREEKLDLNIAAGDHEHSFSDMDIQDSVDRQIIFKIQEL